jgi:hypothetical protein
MKRFLVIIALAAFAATLAAPAVIYAVQAASACCPDEAPKSPCPPGCSNCACCTSVSPSLISAPDVLGIACDSQPAIIESTDSLPTASPRDILHVPKRSLV